MYRYEYPVFLYLKKICCCLKLNVDYRLRTPNSSTQNQVCKWGMIAYSNEIHSVMIGYVTSLVELSSWVKKIQRNGRSYKTLQYGMRVHLRANIDVYTNRSSFCDNHIEPEYRIGGIFTTLSANRYHIGQSSKMGAHVDSGDLNAGMTTRVVFVRVIMMVHT